MFLVAALRADVDAHVLDDAEDRDADLLEHLEALARVEQGDVLRRGDDHRAGHRHLLRQGQLDVAGARRQVDDQVVEVVPVVSLSSCSSAWVTIGPRQTMGVSRSIRKPIDMACRPWACIGSSVLPSARLGLAGDAQHLRLRRAVDVGVEHADAGALGRQRQRQVDRGGGLADAALAGGHGDDVLHAGDQLDAALHGVRDDLADTRWR